MTGTFCIYPWIQQTKRLNGQYSACCRSGIMVDAISPLEAINSEQMDKLRTDLGNGKQVKECQECWDKEKLGYRSSRLIENEEYSEYMDLIKPKLISIEMFNNNECNLKCIMCNSNFSTSWINLEKELSYIDQIYSTNSFCRINHPILLDKEVWKNVEFVSFLGGEPMIAKQNKELLKFLDENDYLEKMTLRITTNTTFSPTNKMAYYFSKAKKLDFGLSIDGIGAVNDWHRYGSNFSKIEKNIVAFSKFTRTIRIQVTSSAFNILELDNTYAYFESLADKHDIDISISERFAHIPEYASANYLSKPLKMKIYEKIKHRKIASYLLEDYPDRTDDIIKYINDLDKLRNTSYKISIPKTAQFYIDEGLLDE